MTARALLLAEIDGATGTTTREYIWLGDMPLAVVADVDTASPVIYYVHVDHLNRPIMMTAGNKANVWQATWLPWGGAHAITGAASLDARFPGQWFQIETGLHYNWHRHYDPTLARYTQADPLGFVDGPSMYAYAANSPLIYVDRDGRVGLVAVPFVVGFGLAGAIDFGIQYLNSRLNEQCFVWNWRQTLIASFAGGFGGGAGAYIGTLGLTFRGEVIANVILNTYIGAAATDITAGDVVEGRAKIIPTLLGGIGGGAGAASGRALANAFRGVGSGVGQGLGSGLADAASQLVSNAVSGSGGLIDN